MKLPEDLGKKLATIRWRIDIGNAETRLACFEAVVRDCAKVCLEYGEKTEDCSGLTTGCHNAILSRYGLVAEQKSVAPQAGTEPATKPEQSPEPAPAATIATARAEGVLEGLEEAAQIACGSDWYSVGKLIRAEIDRRKAEGEGAK